MKITDSVMCIAGVGEKTAKELSRLGIENVGELLSYYPRRYENWLDTVKIADSVPGELCCIRARVTVAGVSHYAKSGILVTECIVADDTGELELTYFNNKYIGKKLSYNRELFLLGKISEQSFYSGKMISPQTMTVEEIEKTGQIKPVYRQSASLKSFKISSIIRRALDASPEIDDPLTEEIRAKYKLTPREQAVRDIHFPKTVDDMENARKRLAFDELLRLFLGINSLKEIGRQETQITVRDDYNAEFFSLLPFSPTGAQKRCINECVNDMKSGRAMNRLLQGDVGSGKTLVAAALMYTMAKNGYQSVLMAPTQLLAEQHFNTLSSMLNGINIWLVTGMTKKKERAVIAEQLKSGVPGVLVGTHAVLNEDFGSGNVGLVISDEQHRFGVRQRTQLSQKGQSPHTLLMSATPIPRTLSMILYGDLDISIIDEYPAGRQPVDTFLVNSSYHERLYAFLKKNMDSGRQCYIVCALADEQDENDELLDAAGYCKRLKNEVFSSYNTEYIHGRLSGKQKEDIMRRFSSGEIQLLVSTTVIEVGIDIPNATVMVIENAERFGLSTLHQLRGRIGRGSEKSTCVLVSDTENTLTLSRLRTLCKTTDGFKIADEDLRLRGPGDYLGSRQHGQSRYGAAVLGADSVLMYRARELAEDISSGKISLAPQQKTMLYDEVRQLLEDYGE